MLGTLCWPVLLRLLLSITGCSRTAVASYHNGIHLAESLQLPPGHPKQNELDSLGLPQGCITYTERGKYWDPNAENPNSKYVVLMRIHHGMPFPADLVLNLRALMEEATEVGLHFYLLYEDSPYAEPKQDDSPEKFLSQIPEEFRSAFFLYDSSDVHNMYPTVHEFEPHTRDYLPIVYFLHRFRQYRYAWILEYDVRYTGLHWGRFLNSALSLARGQLTNSTLSRDEQARAAADYRLPNATDPIPDLVLFGLDMFSDKIHKEGPEPWWPRDEARWNFTTMSLWAVFEMGWSRSLADALHDYSVAGVAGYLEEFVPSTATAKGLNIVSVPVTEFIGPSNHCCTDFAKEFYKEWHRTGECRAFTLLHPVKLFKSHKELGAALLGHNGGLVVSVESRHHSRRAAQRVGRPTAQLAARRP